MNQLSNQHTTNLKNNHVQSTYHSSGVFWDAFTFSVKSALFVFNFVVFKGTCFVKSAQSLFFIKSHIANILVSCFVSLSPRFFPLQSAVSPPKSHSHQQPPSWMSPRSFFSSWSAVSHPKTCPHHQPPS